MNTQDTSTVYHIPQHNLSILQEKLDKLNKRAKKLGVDARLSLNEISRVEKIHPAYTDMVKRKVILPENAPKYWLIDVTLEGTSPQLSGWKLLGVLDHVTLPNAVVVRSVPGSTIPVEFFDSEPVCDHCQVNRARNDTFVLQHENGEYKRVGRQCLRDFLGHNPEFMVYLMQFVKTVTTELQDPDSDYYSHSDGRFPVSYDKLAVLKRTSAMIRSFGWTSKTEEYESDKISTVRDVLTSFNPPSEDSRSYKNWQRFMDSVKFDEKADTEIAKGALEWLSTQDVTNDYLYNLKALADVSLIPESMLGYWCSLVSVHLRNLEKLATEKQKSELKNEYIGEIKKRQNFVVTVRDIKTVETYSQYNPFSYLHRFVTDGGHTLSWFASDDKGIFEVGHKYLVKATVKKHSEYNGWKTTYVNRVTIVEEITD